MKGLLYLSIIVFLFSSCQKKEFTPITSKYQPFIELKDGSVIHARNLEWKSDAFRKEFMINGIRFAKDEVAFYGDGKHSYANAHGKWARLISEGNVNIYKTQRLYTTKANKKNGYAGGPYFTSDRLLFDRYYLRNMQHPENRATLVHLTYKNLEPMIPGNAVAYNYLRQYRKERNVTDITAVAGVGLFVGGLMIVNNKKIHNHENIGWGMMGGGTVMTGVSIAIRIPHSYKLYRVASTYNSR